MRAQRAIVALAVVLLPGVLLAPVWRLAGLGASEDDILYYYPSRVFLHDTVRAGHWPWINPSGGLDRPYAADPQSALWYPFTWLFVALPPLWAYPLNLWVHYSLAIWGMYRLLRASALDRRAALFGGVAFAFCGFMLAHRAHLTMQHAAAWAPWVFWRLTRYVQPLGVVVSNASRIRLSRLAAVAAVGTLQCLAGHAQIAALTALGSLVYLLAQVRPASPSGAARSSFRTAVAARWLVAWVFVAGLFAIQWLPTLAYVRLCTRAQRTFADFTENSWYPASAIDSVLPMVLGQRTPNMFSQPYWGPSHQCEQFGYAGLLPLLLAAGGCLVGWRADRVRRPWVVLLIFSLLLALGRFGPICPLLYWVPGSSLFRVPARALVLFNLALAALAATTLHDLGARRSPARSVIRARLQSWGRHPLRGSLLLIAAPLALIVLSLPLLPADLRWSAAWALRPWNPAVAIPFAAAIISLAVLGFVARRWQQPRWLWLALAVTAADLGVIGWTIDVPAHATGPSALVSGSDEAWLEPIRESDQRLWVVTDTAGVYGDPLGRRVANTNALVGVRALTDYGPLQPTAFFRRFEFAPWGTTERAAALLNDPSWPRPFNVGWMLVCGEQWPPPVGGELVAITPKGDRLYHDPAAPGMAFFDDPTQPGAVRYAEDGPAAFTTWADAWSPATSRAARQGANATPRPCVVVSRLALPGWSANVGAKPCAPEPAHDLLLSVRVQAGELTRIDWKYFPPGLREGAGISTLSALTLLLLVIGSRRRGSPRQAR